MKIIPVTNDNLAAFDLLFTRESLDKLKKNSPDTCAFGAVEYNMPVGAIVVTCAPPEAEIVSLYVVEDFRRNGYGRALFTEALELALLQPEVNYIYASFESKEGSPETLRPFFEKIGLSVLDDGTDYTIRLKQARATSEMKKILRSKKIGECYELLKPAEKNLLYKPEVNLPPYITPKMIREELSFVTFDEQRRNIRDCLIFVEDQGKLVLAWVKTEPGDSHGLMGMVHSAMEELSALESPDRRLHLPTINPTSDELVKHIFSDKLQLYSNSYWAVFRL